MAEINVYEQYFEAQCTAGGRERHAALVMLISDSGGGKIRYKAAVSFFPHDSEDDFAVSYDAYYEETVYEAPGRRSKKREAALLDKLAGYTEMLAERAGGRIFLDRPLREARYG